MVATFHLHCLGHRIKYGNPEVGNTTQQFLSTTRPCCSIEFIESFLFWVILVRYDVGIYICVIFWLSLTVMIFLHCILDILKYEKLFCKLVSRLLHSTIHVIFLGVHSESMFPFMQYFFLKKAVFTLVSLSLAYSWINQPRYSW